MTRGRLRLPWALLLLGACALAYANGLTGAFTYDDKAIVRDNFRLRSPERVVDLFTTQYFGGAKGTGTAYRPLLLLSFAAQWWIHGADPVPFHVVNLLWHAAATLLLARLLLRLAPPPVAVGAALLFAVHPVHVEAVTSIVGRGETLAATLVLGCLLCALRFVDGGPRRWWAFAGALLLYFLGNLTKESAAVAPALFFLILAWSAPDSKASDSKESDVEWAGSAIALRVLARPPVLRRRGPRSGSGLLDPLRGARRAAEVGTHRHFRARKSLRAASAARPELECLRGVRPDARTAGASAAALVGRVGLVHPAARPRGSRGLGRGGIAPAARGGGAPEAPREVFAGAGLSLHGCGGAADLEPALSDGNDLRRKTRLPAVGRLLPDRGFLDRRFRPGLRRAAAETSRRPRRRDPASVDAHDRPQSRVGQRRGALHEHAPRLSEERQGALRLCLHVGADAGIRAARSSTTSGRPRSIRGTGTPGRGEAGWSASSGIPARRFAPTKRR